MQNYKPNLELMKIVESQILMDLIDLNNITSERLENFKKFIQNHVKTNDDLASILSAVHKLKLQSKISALTNIGNKRKDLNFKTDILEIYYDCVLHMIKCYNTTNL